MRRGNEHQQSKRLRNRRRIAAVLTLSMMMSGVQGTSLPVLAEESADAAVAGSEDRISLRLDAQALRAAAENAVQSGGSISLGGSVFAGRALRDSCEGYFSGAHTLYELTLDEIDAALPAELFAREAGLRIFVEPKPQGMLPGNGASFALYAPDGELAELLSGGDLYNGTEAPRFESAGEADYTLDSRALLTFLYQNDGESTKTFTLEVGGEKLDSVRVKPAKKLMPEVLSEVEKRIRTELETGTRAPETSIEQTAENTETTAPESTAEESRAAETAASMEKSAAENTEAEMETAAENTETTVPETAETGEAPDEETAAETAEPADSLVAASLRPIEGFGLLIHRAVRGILNIGVLEARAEEQDGAAVIIETEEAAPEETAAEAETQGSEPEKETAIAPESSIAETFAPETAAKTETGAVTAETTGAVETVAAETSLAESGAAEVLPDTDMGERRAVLERLRQADAREYLDAVMLRQYRASKLLRNIETERKLTVHYRAELGGTVSRAAETVDVLAEDAAFLGAVAEANQKYYSFDGWENTAGEIVSEEPTLIPNIDEIKTNTTFTARFVRNVEMPAFRKTWTGDRLIVTVDVPENTFPKGTELRAREVGEEAAREIVQAAAGSEQEISRAVAVDLSFFYEGQELQPENGNEVRVTMTLSGDRRMDDPIVVHQHDGEAAEAITAAAEITRNSRTQTLEFSAEKFSIYGIGDVKPVMTYRFRDTEGGLLAASYTDAGGNSIRLTEQRVKKGDTVYAPQSPEKENHVFLGWSTTQGKTALDISADELRGDRAAFERFSITTEITKDNAEELDYYPVFTEKLYVFFKESDDPNARTIATVEGAKDTEVILMEDAGGYRVSRIKGLPLQLTQSVTGWHNAAENVQDTQDRITLTDHDITLYPTIEEGHYVYFHTGEGASYVEPEFVAANGTIREPKAPKREGYTFEGWTATEGSTDKFKFNSFNNDWGTENRLDLYAIWKNGSAEYKVYFWKQKAADAKTPDDWSDNDYDFAGVALTKKAATGSTVSADIAEYRNYQGEKKDFQRGFEFSGKNAGSAETVKADGTTVLNVYFDRKLLTIEFRYNEKGKYAFDAKKNFWGDYIHDGEKVDRSKYIIGEHIKGRWYRVYHKRVDTYTGLYGSGFSDPANRYRWPGEHLWRYAAKGSTLLLTLLDEFNFDELGLDSDALLSLTEEESGTAEIVHYLQGKEEKPEDHDENDFTLVKMSAGHYFPNNKYGAGYELLYYKKNSGNWNKMIRSESNGTVIYEGTGIKNGAISIRERDTLYFWYQRKTFTVTFDNQIPAGEAGHQSVSPSKSVKYKDSLSGLRPQTDPTRTGYIFDGWAADKTESAALFDFSQSMPSHDLIVYARWKPAEYPVYVHDMDKEEAALDLGRYRYNSSISQNDMPNVKSGEISIFTGSTEKTINVAAGMSWAGWTVKEGDHYKPYSFETPITGELHLYARYVNTAPYRLEYDLTAGVLGKAANEADLKTAYPNPIADDTRYGAGSVAKLKGSELLAMGADGKEILPEIARQENGADAGTKRLLFLGWSTDKNATTPSCYPNDSFKITADEAETNAETGEPFIRLYAVYGEPEDLAAVKYLANYPEPKGLGAEPKQEYVQSSIANNASLTAIAYSASGFAEISAEYGYEFKGWTKDKRSADALKNKAEDELKTTLLKEGDPFQVDKPEIGADDKPIPNLLYAYWERKPAVTLTIRNVIKGTMANAADQFEYTVTVTKPGEAPATLPKFKLDGQADTKSWSGDPIPVGAKVEVVMTKIDPNYTSSAVKTPKTAGDPEKYEENNGAVTVAEFEMKENTTLTFTHELDAVTPTGIVKDNLPFLLMLLAAGGMGAYFLLGRRRRDEDEL